MHISIHSNYFICTDIRIEYHTYIHTFKLFHMYIYIHTSAYLHAYINTFKLFHMSETYTYKNILTFIHLNNFICIYIYIYIYIHTSAYLHAYINTFKLFHVQRHTHTKAYLHSYIYTISYVHIYTHKIILTCIYQYIQTISYVQRYAYKSILTRIHLNYFVCKDIHMQEHTRIHSYIQTYTYKRILTCIHEYIFPGPSKPPSTSNSPGFRNPCCSGTRNRAKTRKPGKPGNNKHEPGKFSIKSPGRKPAK